jgi:hypothetical protein
MIATQTASDRFHETLRVGDYVHWASGVGRIVHIQRAGQHGTKLIVRTAKGEVEVAARRAWKVRQSA